MISLLVVIASTLLDKTGSLRFEVDSFEPRILDIEVANASGSLRLRFRIRLGLELVSSLESSSELESEFEASVTSSSAGSSKAGPSS